MSVAQTVPQPTALRIPAARPWRRSLSFGDGATVLTASLCINLLAIAAPLTALLIYDRVLLNESRATLAILGGGVIVVILVEAALRLIRAAIISRASAHADFVARNDVISWTLRRPSGAAGPRSLAEMRGRLTSVGRLRELRYARLIAIVDLPFGLAFLVLVGLIGGWSVVLPAGVCVGFVLAMALIAASNGRAIRALQDHENTRWLFVETVARGFHGIAAIATQAPLIDRFVRMQLARAGSQERQTFIDLLSRDVLVVFSQLLIGSVIVAGALAVLAGNLSFGGLAACTLLAGRALEPLQGCVGLLALERRAAVAREDLVGMQGAAPSMVPVRWSHPPAIRFDGAGIAGPTGSLPLLSVPDLSIAPGEIVAISGDRGTGKTTLGLALLGLSPVSGTLAVGGIDVSGPDARSIRAQASYLPRTPQLPGGRLLDILTGGSEELYADVRYLAHLIGLDEAIKRLPSGYDTMLRGDVAGELSDGVRQQVAICRSLARKAKLIVADDTTCTLDAATEIRFANVVKMLAGEATVVLLTDRPSLHRIASRRFELANGVLTPRPVIVGGTA